MWIAYVFILVGIDVIVIIVYEVKGVETCTIFARVCVCVCACMCACVCVCLCACMCFQS